MSLAQRWIPQPPRWPASATRWPLPPDVVLLGLVVFAACGFGSMTRAAGTLASVWPANALLLGILLRRPELARPSGWFAAATGYVASDLSFGGDILPTLGLTVGNLVGVLTGFALFMRMPVEDRRLSRPSSVLRMALASSAAAAAAGVIGAIINPIFFKGDPLSGWIFWFVAELAAYISLLPVILTMPAMSWPRLRIGISAASLRAVAPVLTLVLSFFAAMAIGGVGALALPSLALLWCALSYSVFVTCIVTLAFSHASLIVISSGYLPVALDLQSTLPLLSIRLGVTLETLGPIVVASVIAERDALMRRIEDTAARDFLTGLLNRGAFVERSQKLLAGLAERGDPVAILMIDIDRFKAINDMHGHALGDRAIVALADRVRGALREGDIAGRIGGEEFAVVLAGCGQADTASIAERIRCDFAQADIRLEEEGASAAIAATASIGVAFALPAPANLDYLLSMADRALYAAKSRGRNRVEGAGPSGALTLLVPAVEAEVGKRSVAP